MSTRWRIAVVVATLVGLAGSLALAARTFGTNDVLNYERFEVWSHYLGASMYIGAPGQIDFPPAMIHVLRALAWTAQRTGVPFPFWLRFLGILANAGSVWVLVKILGAQLADRRIAAALVLFAMAPPLVLIAGFHGNTDPIMMFLVLVTIWLAKEKRPWLAGGAFGLAMSVKVVPLILVPVLFFAWPTLRKKIVFFAAAGLVWFLASSPFVFQEPRAIAEAVFGYRSAPGWWGVTWLAGTLDMPALDDALASHGPLFLFAAIAALSLYMNLRREKPSLYAQAGMVFLLFLAGTTGFGVQYLAWIMPWMVGLGIGVMAPFCVASSAFLIVVYNFWTNGYPWYIGLAEPWDQLQYFQAACWLSVIAVVWFAWMSIRRREPVRFPGSAASQAIALTVLAVLLVIAPMAAELRAQAKDSVPPHGEESVLAWRADAYSELSDELSKRGRSADAEAAQRESQRLEALSEKLASDRGLEAPNHPANPNP